MHATSFPDLKPFERQGYTLIGYSSFNSGNNEQASGAVAQAKRVGADLVVIIDPSFSGSTTSQLPLVMPTSTTSYTRGSATVQGSGGSVTAHGNSTKTTYGSNTTYIPITVTRYDYGAVYFIKHQFTLGVHWRPLEPDERQALESNSGVFVETVVNGTPAFRNDILPGDIILAINGERVYGVTEASDLIAQFRGQEVVLTTYRDGRVIEKSVKLNK